MTATSSSRPLVNEILKSQSAFQISKTLLSTDYQLQNEFLATLKAMYEDFLRSRNPLYPRHDVLTYLTNTLIRTENRQIMNIIIALFIEFCQESKQYDCVFVKKELLQLNITQILGTILHTSHLQKQVTQVELTMLLLDNLSDSLLPSQSNFVQTELIPKCLSLCDSSQRRLFHYQPSLKHKMRDLLVDKALIISNPSYEDGASKEKCELMQYLFGCKKMVFSYCSGEVWDTSDTTDVNIGKQIIESKLVWYSHNTTEQNGKHKAKSYLSIIPTSVLIGPHFLAHTYEAQQGDNSSSLIETQLSEIESLLTDQPHKRLLSPPDFGDLVTVYGQIESAFSSHNGSKIYYRAQVGSSVEDKYLVVSLDYGFVSEVSLSSLYERCQSALHIRPSTIVCSISGIQPSPASEQILESALNILAALCRGNFTVMESIAQHRGLQILIDVSKISAREAIAVQAMNVLSHMAQSSKLKSDEVVKEEIIPILIELITLYSNLNWINALNTAIKLLANLILSNPDTHDQLNPALSDIIKLISIHHQHSDVRKSVLQFLSNILSEHKLTQDEITQLVQERKTKSPRSMRKSRSVPTFSNEISQSNEENTRTAVQDSQCDDATRVTRRLYDLQPTSNVNNSNVGNRIQRVEPIKPEPDLESVLLQRETFVTASASDKTYILDEDTGLVQSDVYEICQNHVSKMDTESLKKLIVGFLNSGTSGSIMFGLTETGKVIGLNINRDERDQLRLALDRIVTDFEPKILANDTPQLLFCPVNVMKVINGKHEEAPIRDRYVIEIILDTNPNIETAYTLKQNSAIFMRTGLNTVNVTVQKYREMITQYLERQLDV